MALLKYTYDGTADALYIYTDGDIAPGGSVKTKVAVDDHMLMLDYDKDDRIIGIEVLFCRQWLRVLLPGEVPTPETARFAPIKPRLYINPKGGIVVCLGSTAESSLILPTKLDGVLVFVTRSATQETITTARSLRCLQLKSEAGKIKGVE
jgi:uncharacterized protein YuzE